MRLPWENTLKNVKCDIILNGSPIDLSKLVNVNKPIIKVTYDIKAIGTPSIETVLDEFVSEHMK